MLVVLHDQDFSPQGYGKDLPGRICNRIAEGHTSGGPSQTDPDPRRDNSGISSHTFRETGWKSLSAREKANGASGSTINGGYASTGRTAMRVTSKLLITIKGEKP